MSRRRQKLVRFTIRPDSPLLVARMAALLAYQSLPWAEQNKFDDKAKEILRLMYNMYKTRP